MRIETRTTVQCYAGYKGEERPTSFTLRERTMQVLDIVDRWYDPDSNYFKVRADDGQLYLLRRDLDSGLWGLIEEF